MGTAVKEDVTEDFLKMIGFTGCLLGDQYLLEAIKMYYSDPAQYKRKIKKEIYTQIAKSHATNVDCIEKDIRMAIEKVFTQGKPAILYKYYGDIIRDGRTKPEAARFIIRTVEILKNRR